MFLLVTSIVALSRSKSLDRDSYNSGYWFNRLDFTYESNNWEIGLPPKDKNENNWLLMMRLLGIHLWESSAKYTTSSSANNRGSKTAIWERSY